MGSDIVSAIFLDIVLLIFGIILFAVGLSKRKQLDEKIDEEKYYPHARMNYFHMMFGGVFAIIIAVVLILLQYVLKY